MNKSWRLYFTSYLQMEIKDLGFKNVLIIVFGQTEDVPEL